MKDIFSINRNNDEIHSVIKRSYTGEYAQAKVTLNPSNYRYVKDREEFVSSINKLHNSNTLSEVEAMLEIPEEYLPYSHDVLNTYLKHLCNARVKDIDRVVCCIHFNLNRFNANMKGVKTTTHFRVSDVEHVYINLSETSIEEVCSMVIFNVLYYKARKVIIHESLKKCDIRLNSILETLECINMLDYTTVLYDDRFYKEELKKWSMDNDTSYSTEDYYETLGYSNGDYYNLVSFENFSDLVNSIDTLDDINIGELKYDIEYPPPTSEINLVLQATLLFHKTCKDLKLAFKYGYVVVMYGFKQELKEIKYDKVYRYLIDMEPKPKLGRMSLF